MAPNSDAAPVTDDRRKACSRAASPMSRDDLPTVALTTNASELTMQAIAWLWPYWIARGAVHLAAGPPGVGKTSIALSLAATVSRGGDWPDGSHAPQGRVVIWSGEDSITQTLLPRLVAMGADLNYVEFVCGVELGNGRRAFDPARDMEALHARITELGDVAMVVIDPIVSAVSGDSHKAADVRRSLQPLVDLAEATACALLGICHFNKGTSGRDPLERVSGSVGFGAVVRVAFAVARDQGNDRLIFARAKNNLGPSGGGFVYVLEQRELGEGIEASYPVWGAWLEGDAQSLLGQEEPDLGRRREAEDARDWLLDQLAAGPQTVKDLQREAEKEGLAWRTVRRAAFDVLGVVGSGPKCDRAWSLPTQPTGGPALSVTRPVGPSTQRRAAASEDGRAPSASSGQWANGPRIAKYPSQQDIDALIDEFTLAGEVDLIELIAVAESQGISCNAVEGALRSRGAAEMGGGIWRLLSHKTPSTETRPR